MGKIFITGPGRSGTTFLVQLLTRLGCDTGFEPYNEVYVEEWRAGCERNIGFFPESMTHEELRKALDDAPRIIKGPVWAYLLKFIHTLRLAEIDHIVMPMRDLSDSAKSRLGVGLAYMVDELQTTLHGREEAQENLLAMLVGKVLEAHYIYGIPLTLMRFPNLVQDEAYCFRKVSRFVEIEREGFGEVWRGLSNPEQIRHK